MKKQLLFFCFLMPVVFGHAQSPEDFIPYKERQKSLVQSIGFSPDGSTLYMSLFERLMRNTSRDSSAFVPELAIYAARKNGEAWGQPERLSFTGVYDDYEPTISPDGKHIFFNSKRPAPDSTQPSKKNRIWYVERKGKQWMQPKFLSRVNEGECGKDYATIARNRQLYYVREICTTGDETKSHWKIYTTHFAGEKTLPGTPVFNNTAAGWSEADPWVSPKNDYLILTRFNIDSSWDKTCDLYISFRKDNKWLTPVPLKELNTAGPDYAVAVSPDENWIYFRASHYMKRAPFKTLLEAYRKQYG